MKNIIFALIILISFAGCSATELVSSWKRIEMEPQRFDKLVVVVMSPKIGNRAAVETALADEMIEKGIRAIPSVDYFPLAGKIKEFGYSPEELKEIIKEKVEENNIDGLMIVTLLDKEKEQRYVEGSGFSVTGPGYYGGYPNYPTYAYPYYGYYSYAHTTVYSSGYYATSTTYFVEANLYDTKAEHLIYSGQTKTKDPTSINTESKNFAEIVVTDMFSKGVFVR